MTSNIKVNPDIKEERDKVSFNIEEFTNWFYGGKEKVVKKRFLGKLSRSLSHTEVCSILIIDLLTYLK
jgi:hypothetical protein